MLNLSLTELGGYMQDDITCLECQGHSSQVVLSLNGFGEVDGYEEQDCPDCMGTGLNDLGLILAGYNLPPEDGCGPVDLEKVLAECRYDSQKAYEALLAEANKVLGEAA